MLKSTKDLIEKTLERLVDRNYNYLNSIIILYKGSRLSIDGKVAWKSMAVAKNALLHQLYHDYVNDPTDKQTKLQEIYSMVEFKRVGDTYFKKL